MNEKAANPRKNRRSIRLKEYDYSRAGMYFVTICAKDRACLFGEIVDGEVVLNDAGRMVQTVWNEIPDNYPGVEIDAFIVMPNHVHGIIVLVGASPRACPFSAPCGRPFSATRGCPNLGQPWGIEEGQPQGVAPTIPEQDCPDAPTALSLPDVVHRFKTMTTKRYVDGIKQRGWPPFPGKLWHRNYYERVIRDDEELNNIREYIVTNPARWELDRENPKIGS